MKNDNNDGLMMIMLIAAVLIALGIMIYFISASVNNMYEDGRWTQRQINTGIALCTQYDGQAYFEQGQLYCTTSDNTFEVPKIPKAENTPP